jgi:hypothetical protein
MKLQLKKIALLAALIFSVNLCNAAFPVKEAPAAVSQELVANNLKDGITETRFAANENYSPAAPSAPATQQKGGGFGIASFTCGVVGLLVAGIPLGIAAIVFGVLGMSGDRPLKGLAIAGMIIGMVDVIAVALYLASM